jgi:release factor glutamine methyltransferase
VSEALQTVAQVLTQAKAAGLERLDAQQLLAHVLARPRAWLLAHDDAELSTQQAEAYRGLVQRRAAGEPFAYLVGEREFHGLTLKVSPAVLIPRPDTETLVDWALELLAGEFAALPAPRVIDLGTGSGAIALAVKHRHPSAQVTAIDASPQALAVAQHNAQTLGLSVQFAESNWWQALGDQSWHLALSNPPYIAGDDPHLDALRHEPREALTPGGNGFSAIDTLLAGAPAHLQEGGWLLIEHGHEQGGGVRERLVTAGFMEVCTRSDIEGRERCSGGRWCRRDTCFGGSPRP